MNLDQILSEAGPHKRAKRVGRGRGSGCGKTSSRGQKGFGSRAGSNMKFGHEGGQNPMLRRIPKRGFNNENFATVVEVVNVSDLERAFEDGAEVTAQALADKRLISDAGATVKVLGDGNLSRKLTVRVHRASKSAGEKIAAAGGTVELLK